MPLPEFKQIVDAAKQEIQEIGLDDLERMQRGREDFLLLDVREAEEAQRGMIPGAVHVSRGMLEYKIDSFTTDKNKKLVLYCGGGSRSALAAQSLKHMGFKDPISLRGGYRGWSESQGKK